MNGDAEEPTPPPDDRTSEGPPPSPDAAPPRRGRFRRWVPRVVIAAIALFALIQAIPYGRGHTDPPVVAEPAWDSPRTQQLFTQACADCHSNLTTWPWYSNIAPASWLVQRDVDGGRKRLNVSEWQRPQEEAGHAADVVRRGDMPPVQYKLIHSDARLSSAEREELAAGLARTFAASPPGTAR